MPGALTSDSIGRPPVLPPEGGFWDDGRRPDWGGSRRASFTALMVLLAATTMIFAALTSAFFMRRGFAGDWRATPLPPLLWANTAVLLMSSCLIEAARWSLQAGWRTSFNCFWTAATACGLFFLAGQAIVWSQLRDSGVYVAANPSSAFFFLLTAAHAVHVAGGMGGLIYVDLHALRYALGPSRRTAADVAAVFWHFLDGLWLFLLLLFSFWG